MQEEDAVNSQWLARHGISIPRAAGYYESATAWVKVDNAGRITHAGLRDQTILSDLISRRVIGEEAQYYGFTYLDWRAAYYARIEAAQYSHERGGSASGWTKEEKFSKLMLAVPRKHMRYVEIMTAGNPFDTERVSAAESPAPYLVAYGLLRSAIDSIADHAETVRRAQQTA